MAGKVSEKPSTPRAAHPVPAGILAPPADRTAFTRASVALSFDLIDKDSSIATLAATLRRQIDVLQAGAVLPSTRALVERHHVSPVTVSRALAQLAAEGLVTVRPGAGSFVNERGRPAAEDRVDTSWQAVPLADRSIDASRLGFLLQPAPDGVLSLAAGYPHPDLMATGALTAAAARAARRPGVWDRPPALGLQRLRSWFARSLGGAFDADDVLVTDGGQSALSTAFRALLAPGAPVLVESPTYLGALAAARSAGLRTVPVPIDEGGLQLDKLSDAFSSTGSRVLYCQPTFQNPTGGVLANDRREGVLKLAASAGAFVIEDDYARWLSHRSPAPAPLASEDRDGRVVYITSITKPTSANLRIGAIIARGPVAERLRNLRLVDDFFASRLLQETALELLDSPAWTRHLHTLSAALSARCAATIKAVSRNLPTASIVQVPQGGMHIWLRLVDGMDDTKIAEEAERAGVLVMPGRPFYAAEPPGAHVRLSFCGVSHTRELEEAIVRLSRACA